MVTALFFPAANRAYCWGNSATFGEVSGMRTTNLLENRAQRLCFVDANYRCSIYGMGPRYMLRTTGRRSRRIAKEDPLQTVGAVNANKNLLTAAGRSRLSMLAAKRQRARWNCRISRLPYAG